jgi:transcriptional regulator with XRE-family HTH domain
MSIVGTMIKKRRKELGLTQEELAKKMGYVSKSTIAKIESGTNDITQPKIVDFAKILEVPPSYLMGWKDENGTVGEKHTLDLELLFKSKNVDYIIMFMSEIVKTERINNELTEKFVATKAGIPLSEYLSFENDYKNIGVEKIIRLIPFTGPEFYYVYSSMVALDSFIDTIDSMKNEKFTDAEFKKNMVKRHVSNTYIMMLREFRNQQKE